MLALYNTKVGVIVQRQGAPGAAAFTIPGTLLAVHNPQAGWTSGDFKVVELVVTGSPPSQFYNESGETLALNGNTLTLTKTYTPMLLATVKPLLVGEIDRAADRVRGRFASPLATQVGIYVLKKLQAEAVLALPNPDDADEASYPLVAADLAVDAASMSEAARNIKAQADAWETIAGVIEATRRGTNQAIENAASVDAAVVAYNAATWPEPA